MANQMIVQVLQADGSIREVVVESGERLILGPEERLVVAANPDQTRVTNEADGATTIVLEGVGEFTVETAGDIPQDPTGVQVASAPLAMGAPRPVIIFETVGSDAGTESGSVTMEPLGIHEASTGDTGFVSQHVDASLGMGQIVELAAFHADEVGGGDGFASGGEDEQSSLFELVNQGDQGGAGSQQSHAPVANPVDLGSMNEDGGSVTITMAQLLSGASDADGDALTASGLTLSNPAAGMLVDNGDGTWTFTPAANWNGSLSFGYDVSDGNGGVTSNTASLTVNPVNDAPEVTPVDLGSMNEDAGSLTITMADLLSGASDVDGDTLTVSGLTLSDPAAGTLVDNGDGTWTFTPATDWNGSLSFNYDVSDGNGGNAAGVAAFTVNPVNDPPVAGDVDLQDVHQDTPLTIYASELLANSYDVDSGDTISITSLTLSNPAAGTLVDSGDGTWTFTPASGFVGEDVAFSFTVSDNHGATDTGTALVDVVTGPNHPPVVNPVYLGTMNEDGSLTFTTASLLGHSSDLDGDALAVTSVSVDPFYGTVTDNGDGTWTFTPKADYYGNNVGMTFTVSDGNGGVGSSVAVVDVLCSQFMDILY